MVIQFVLLGIVVWVSTSASNLWRRKHSIDGITSNRNPIRRMCRVWNAEKYLCPSFFSQVEQFDRNRLLLKKKRPTKYRFVEPIDRLWWGWEKEVEG